MGALNAALKLRFFFNFFSLLLWFFYFAFTTHNRKYFLFSLYVCFFVFIAHYFDSICYFCFFLCTAGWEVYFWCKPHKHPPRFAYNLTPIRLKKEKKFTFFLFVCCFFWWLSGWLCVGGQLDSGPSTPLPDKKLLLFILDRLQKCVFQFSQICIFWLLWCNFWFTVCWGFFFFFWNLISGRTLMVYFPSLWTRVRLVLFLRVIKNADALSSRICIVCFYLCYYSEIYVFMQLPDYHEVIEHPMDFGTVRKKVSGGAYATLEQFEVGLSSYGFILVKILF